MNRQISFSARDNGVSSFMDKMRRSALDLGRGILQDSDSQNRSAKQTISDYEAQISLIEKKNRLHERSAKLNAKRARDSQVEAATTSADRKKARETYSNTISQISDDSEEDKIQTSLLREIIDAIKNSASQEIRSDAINSNRESDDLERLIQGEDGNDFRTVAQKLREESSGTPASNGGRSGGSNVINNMSSIAQQQDGAGAVQTTLDSVGKGPIWGTVVGVLAAAFAGLKIRADREKSAEEIASLANMNVGDIIDSSIGSTNFYKGFGPSTLGVSREEYLNSYMPGAARAMGTTDGSGKRAMDHIMLEKGFGMTQGTVESLSRFGRASGGGDPMQMMRYMYGSLHGTGAFGHDNTDMTRMEELVSGINNFQEQQFSASGVTNGYDTLRTRRGLEKLGGRFTRDDYSMQTIQGLNSGLMNAGSPEARAVKFDVLRRQNPNKSFFELQTEMDSGINSNGYLSGMLDFIKGTGGDLNSQSLLMDSLTGGQMRKRDITDILKGNMTLEDFEAQDLGAKDRAINSTSRANEQLLNLTEQFKDIMSTFGGGVEEALNFLRGMSGELSQIKKDVRSVAELHN